MIDHKLSLALVVWNDASTTPDEPITLEDVGSVHYPVVVHTLGWILRDDEVGITLVNEFYEGTYRGRTFIPRGMIVSVTPFRLTRMKKKVSSNVS